MDGNNRIIWVENDRGYCDYFLPYLRVAGFEVEIIGDAKTAKDRIARQLPKLVILDINIPMPEDEKADEWARSEYGGVELAIWIKTHYSSLKFIGLSNVETGEPANFFRLHASAFIEKSLARESLLDAISSVTEHALGSPNVQSFIVHGHADGTKFELKNFLQNILRFPQPIILHEQPDAGRTIIEKLEEYARKATVVFVLLTPDDLGGLAADPDERKLRARQNVIFEMGYFLGMLGRKSGRVMLLHKGPIELPSDIYGLVYIDITHGIDAAGERIRRELKHWQPALSL